MGSDRVGLLGHLIDNGFQSTLPGWGATGGCHALLFHLVFQSTLPGWGATTMEFRTPLAGLISIHAPRMGSDITPIQWRKMTFISIHAPRMGSDHVQSGLDLRGTISIHAPRMGSDPRGLQRNHHRANLNPRSPDGERPRKWTSSPTIWAKSSIFNTDCIADRR